MWGGVGFIPPSSRLPSAQAFRHFDPEGIGFVDEPEMRRMLKQLAEDDEVHSFASTLCAHTHE